MVSKPLAKKIVYIIDMSISMRARGYHARRYDRAVAEVLKSIDQLEADQKFFVYLFCFKKYEMKIGQSYDEFCEPSQINKERLRIWLRDIQLGAGTDPRESLVSALKKSPSCVFLLSDGEFNGEFYGNGQYGKKVSAVTLAEKHNLSSCPIHTIGLEDRRNQRVLTKIADQSGGIYRFVRAER